MRSPGPSCPSAPAWSGLNEQLLPWAYAGHPPALWLGDGRELIAPTQGTPLGVRAGPRMRGGLRRSMAGAGVLLYTDGLTEARRDGKQFGLDGVSAALGGLRKPAPTEAVAVLRARVAEFAYGTLTDDLCLLAARISRWLLGAAVTEAANVGTAERKTAYREFRRTAPTSAVALLRPVHARKTVPQ
jgi:Stage II sporulation protein E (SpoIIE)